MQNILRWLIPGLVILSLNWGTLAHAKKSKMVIIGDSITEGYGVSREQAYPALLQKKLEASGKDWQVVNAGISGSTTASAPSRVGWTLKQKPQLLLIALGGNDGLRGHSIKSIEDNLSKALRICREAGVKVLLAGVPLPPNYGEKYRRDFNRAFAKVAEKTKTPLIPSILSGVAGDPSLNLPDGIHPNEKGHAVIAETLFQELKKHL